VVRFDSSWHEGVTKTRECQSDHSNAKNFKRNYGSVSYPLV
jgi:hypothetical protein